MPQPSYQPPKWPLVAVKEDREQQKGVLRSEDKNFQECNNIPTVQNNPPGEWSNTQLSMYGLPMKPTPLVNIVHISGLSSTSLSRCLLVSLTRFFSKELLKSALALNGTKMPDS